MLIHRIIRVGVLFVFAGCGVLHPKPVDQQLELLQSAEQTISAEQAGDLLDEIGGSWAYGEGIGMTSVKVGSWFVFPPYGMYLLGNSVLELAGFERIEVTDVLPEEEEKAWDKVHDAIISAPGRVVAAVAGKEYRTRQEATRRIRRVLHPELGAYQDLELYLNEDVEG